MGTYWANPHTISKILSLSIVNGDTLLDTLCIIELQSIELCHMVEKSAASFLMPTVNMSCDFLLYIV